MQYTQNKMGKTKIRKIGFALLWLGFVSYAFLLAPPDRPDTVDLIIRLSTGEVEGINSAIVALFYQNFWV